MSPSAWQQMTCLPVVLCETCQDVALARSNLCGTCRDAHESAGDELALVLVSSDFEAERFFRNVRGVAW